MNMSQTLFLFATPSALAGAARLFDFGGSMSEHNDARFSEEADTIALAMDWIAVGADLTAVASSPVDSNA